MKVKLEVYNPSGTFEMTAGHAPRVASLSGKTICELSNDHWQNYKTFPLIRELLRKQFPDANFVPYTEFPVGSHNNKIDVDEIGKIIAGRGCQAVIGGNSA